MVGWLPGITLCGTTAAGVPVGRDLLGGPAERERGGLREEVRHEQVVHLADVVVRLG